MSETRATEETVPACSSPAAIITGRLPLPNHRYGVARVSQATGQLFPLRVGAQLRMAYTVLYRGWSPETGCRDQRFEQRVHYAVLSANDAFTIGEYTVPGRVYLIERTRLDDAGKAVAKRDYYYSEALGWVVMEVEYTHGIPGSIRQMTNWH